MADDLSEKLKSLLSDPNTMNMLSSLVGNSDSQPEKNVEAPDDFSQKISSAISGINSGNDRRINLLNALKPYMRQSRSNSIDKAVKMLKISQMTSLFKDL